MRTSPRGLALIRRFEGFPNGGCPYVDPVGVWTRGYGRTEGIGPGSRCISKTEATRELRHLLARDYEPHLAPFAWRSQNEYDAIASTVWNLGPGVLAADRSLGRALRSGSRRRVAAALMLYVFAGGVRFAGLVRRRNAERKLYLSPMPGVRLTDVERALLRRPLTPATRRALRAQARRVQFAARAPRRLGGGWDRHDRARRFRALRRRALTR